MSYPRRQCAVCARTIAARPGGDLYPHHRAPGRPCPAWRLPATTPPGIGDRTLLMRRYDRRPITTILETL